jgi:hypothetical protein
LISKITGFDKLDNMLVRLSEQWETIQAYTAVRLAQQLKENLGDDDKYLYVVQVDRGADTHYGVTLEPEPKKRALESLAENEVVVLSPQQKDPQMAEIAMQGPWLPEYIPVIPERKQDGFLWIRQTHQADIEELAKQNTRSLSQMGYNADEAEGGQLDQSRSAWMMEDLAFNQLRGEFGLSDNVDPKWRPALKEAMEDQIYEIWDDVVNDFLEDNISLQRLGEIEQRDPEFFDQFAEFTLAVIPQGMPKRTE